MPPWGNTLSRRQVSEVVLYVRSLGKAKTPGS
jgi:mono/diheme cytochrome c family protein